MKGDASSHGDLQSLVDAVLNGTLTRRELLLRAGVLGLSATTLGSLLAACGGGGTSASPSSASSISPRQGGSLRIGLTGGASSDTLNPQALVTTPDLARSAQLYNGLVEFNNDAELVMSLAEELEASSDAMVWTVRVRQGVTFHNGKELGADDVIYTFQKALNPKAPSPAAPMLTPVDINGMRKLDARTVRIPCRTPFSYFDQMITPYNLAIIPVGWDQKHPVGTGPFKFQSFSPGSTSTFVRNDNYFESGLPYADSLVITDYADETAQVNALLSGQEDAIGALSVASTSSLQGMSVVFSDGGGITPFTMRVDTPPFNDPRVREAMRWIVDRKQMRDAVFAGHGVIGNDVTSIWDPTYDHSLPQREQDIARAKLLLKQAGQDHLAVELVTAPIQQGTVQAAQVFAQQAKAAGVNVKLRTVTATDFFGPNYLKWVFAQDFYYYEPYFLQVVGAFLPTSTYNETHFNNPTYNQLNAKALATVDKTARAQIVHEMMRMDYEIGGYIIPYFVPVIDAHSPKLMGLAPGKTGAPLSNLEFKNFWLSS